MSQITFPVLCHVNRGRTARKGSTFDDVAHLASGVRGRAYVLGAGGMEGGVWWASQAQGLVHDVPTCQQVVGIILAEAERIIEGVLPATCRPASTPAES